MDAAKQQLGKVANRARSKEEYERAMPEQKALSDYYGSSATNFDRIDPKAKVKQGRDCRNGNGIKCIYHGMARWMRDSNWIYGIYHPR